MSDILPNPLCGSLDELLISGASEEKSYNVFIGHNLGYRVFSLQIPMKQFFEISEVANEQQVSVIGEVAQRKLDPNHAQKLAIYILKGLISSAINHRKVTKKMNIPELLKIQEELGKQPYLALQPLVANLRDVGTQGQNIRGERILSKSDDTTACFKIFLAQNNILWIIDGQHRREGMRLVFEFLDNILRSQVYNKKKSLYLPTDGHHELTSNEIIAWEAVIESTKAFATVSVEVHLGLNLDEERQLFHDLNNLGKKVDKNLALKFDSSNPINLFIKEILVDELGIDVTEIEQKDWEKDDGKILLKDLVAINAILFLNKTNVSSAKPEVKDQYDIAKRFWSTVMAINYFGEAKAKLNTVAVQPVVLKAIAKLVYDFAFSKRKPLNSEELLTTLLDGITDIDFSHNNKIWQYYDLDIVEKEGLFPGLDIYLPDNTTGNRDIGSYQNELMRFSPKHNDIYPIIGDMIRWTLNLPSRN